MRRYKVIILRTLQLIAMLGDEEMRVELKNIVGDDYWCYGLNESDFDYILRLVEDFISCRQRELEEKKEKVILEHPDPEIHGEIISDNAHYYWVDVQYLWQFCLWRLQGILEGLIVYSFLPKKPEKKMIGIKSKLDVLRKSGYSISGDEYEELINWANLRNALSHAPPEQYRPGTLTKDDVKEYKSFIEGLCVRWRCQEKKVKNA